MIARSRIWEELKQSKSNIICIQHYVDKNRQNNRLYNGFIAIVSSIGALGYVINEYIPFIASLCVALVSIIKSISPSFIQPEQELVELDKLSDFYSSYMNSIEKIWYNLDQQVLDEKKSMEIFFTLKECECDKLSILNKGVRSISKREQHKIDIEAEEYINRVYFTKT